MCTALAFLLFFALIGEVGATRATVITYVNPAVAVVLGVTVLNEHFGVATGVGFALILVGCLLATRADDRPSSSPAVPPIAEPAGAERDTPSRRRTAAICSRPGRSATACPPLIPAGPARSAGRPRPGRSARPLVPRARNLLLRRRGRGCARRPRCRSPVGRGDGASDGPATAPDIPSFGVGPLYPEFRSEPGSPGPTTRANPPRGGDAKLRGSVELAGLPNRLFEGWPPIRRHSCLVHASGHRRKVGLASHVGLRHRGRRSRVRVVGSARPSTGSRSRSEEGMGLIEVVLSISLLLLIIVPMSYLFTNVIGQAASARQEVTAIGLADSLLEQLNYQGPPNDSNGQPIVGTSSIRHTVTVSGVAYTETRAVLVVAGRQRHARPVHVRPGARAAPAGHGDVEPEPHHHRLDPAQLPAVGRRHRGVPRHPGER